jgi:hypothetical protein
MDCEKLRREGYIEATGRGKRVDVQIRVYPEGFGQIILRRREPQVHAIELMCNNAEEAQGYLREIWDCLQRTSGAGE